MRSFVIFVFCGLGAGCVPADRAFREVSGPAKLAIMSPWGVSMHVDIEDGGRYFSGPDFDKLYINEEEGSTNE